MKIESLMLVCVDVRSAHNIGSFFRTCDGFNAQLFIVGGSPRPRHEHDDRLPYVIQKAEKEIAKTALGAEHVVKWWYADTFSECVDVLRSKGYVIYGIEQDDRSVPIQDLQKQTRVALVVGREVEGLSPIERKRCDSLYEIPMAGKKESFNVSIAASIALYEARR